MLGYLPPYYDASKVMRAILQAQGSELDKFRYALDDILAQFFVETATWGLDTWERELGIPKIAGKPDAERRSNIIAKLRGIGTVTIATIKNVAESFFGGRVEVTDRQTAYTYDVYRDIPNDPYTFTIFFADIYGVPPNIDDLKRVIEEIKPAHLAVVYKYNYLIWATLDNQALTWDALDLKALSWAEFETGGWLN